MTTDTVETTETTALTDGDVDTTEANGDALPNPGDLETTEAPEGAPEAYADFTMPEGMEVDNTLMEGFQAVAKELGLSQEAAQKIVDAQTAAIQAEGEAVDSEWATLNEQWVEDARNDPEIGGSNWDVSLSDARKAVAQFGNEGFKEALEVTGLGNHPDAIRFMAKIGKAMGEDTLHTGSAAAPVKKSQAEILFPSMNKE